MNTIKTSENTTKKNIYQKLHEVQQQVKLLGRTENIDKKFLKYTYFSESQALDLIKPLLKEQKLLITISDHPSSFEYKVSEKGQYEVKFLKQFAIHDIEVDPTAKKDKEVEALAYSFWACGSNTDLAKAKGSADTYAIKYLLHKFFLVPVKDSNDPDFVAQEEAREYNSLKGGRILTSEEQTRLEFLKKRYETDESKETK